MAVKVLTTNLSPLLYDWISAQAKAHNATKRLIVESALERDRIAEKKRLMAKMFDEMSKDPLFMEKMVDMAEEGIVEWGIELDKIDGGYFSERNIPRKTRSRRGERTVR